MKKFITLITIIIFINFINLHPIFAAEPTSIATPSSKLQLKLKALQEEIASKAAKLKQEVSKKLTNKAYVGFVKSVSSTSLTLALDTGTKIITINEFTEFLGGTKTKKFNLNSIETDTYLAALGDVDETEVLTAKKIIKLDPNKIKRKVVFGIVTTLGEQSFTIKTAENQRLNFSTGSKTIFYLGKNEAEFEDVKLNKSIIVVGTESEGSTFKARFIYILPKISNIQEEKESTPSTSSGQVPSATPKATPKIKKSV